MEANETLAYAAGFLDGEGCVMTRGGTISSIIVQVTNSNESVIHYMNALLPGRIYGQKRYGRKRIYRLVWTGQEAVNVLELLMPYLVVKRTVAELALEFWYNCIAYADIDTGEFVSAPTTVGRHLDEAELILRRSYSSRIRELNHGG